MSEKKNYETEEVKVDEGGVTEATLANLSNNKGDD